MERWRQKLVGAVVGLSLMVGGHILLSNQEIAQASTTAPVKWEYLIKSGQELTASDQFIGNPDADANLLKNLNRIGEEGWELVSMNGPGGAYFVFKRKK
ncbi:MAG: hypothetical protein ACKO6N_16315 [Myxococcota bacterium]